MLKPLVLTFLLIYMAQAAKLPKNWKKCKRNDPKLDDCLRVAVTFAARDLKDGNANLGILPLDPLRIDQLVIDQGQGPVSVKMVFSNFSISGHRNVEVLSVKNDWKDVYLKAIVPKMTLRGKYKMDGKVLTLPIRGEGNCSLDAEDFTSSLHLVLRNNTKNGKHYFAVEKFDVLKLDAEKGHVHFDNLFNGDKSLGDAMNRFLNANWREILTEITPALSKSFGLAYMRISNRILSKVPGDELFLS
ncbi:protein takeout-like [Rhodnius prolixus]|uniref:Uncharacterized protein n=2 Tax=Rhodnius prolixus TaxID=13249 RepID=T1I1C8_RHOPR